MRPLRDQPRNFDEYTDDLTERFRHGLRATLRRIAPGVLAVALGLLLVEACSAHRAKDALLTALVAVLSLGLVALLAWWRGELGQLVSLFQPGARDEEREGWAGLFRRRRVTPGPLRCPYCHEELERGLGLVCGTCRAHAHTGCWVEHGRCAACGSRELMGLPEGVRSMVRAELYPGHPALRDESSRRASARVGREKPVEG